MTFKLRRRVAIHWFFQPGKTHAFLDLATRGHYSDYCKDLCHHHKSKEDYTSQTGQYGNLPFSRLSWLRQVYSPLHITPTLRLRCHLGGHSSEALSLVSALDFSRYTPRTYLVSEGDSLSAQKAVTLEQLKTAPALSLASATSRSLGDTTN